MRKFLPALVLATLLLAAVPALAHKVVADVYPSGDVLEGEIGYSTGDVAANAAVEVFDDNHNKLGETRTNEKGVFTFKPTQRLAHTFHADMGGGHIANVRVAVEDLPPLPAAEGSSSAAGGSALTPDQVKLLAEAVRREVKPLRQAVLAHMEKNDLQSILGGIGYIMGLCGVGFYMAARHKMKKG